MVIEFRKTEEHRIERRVLRSRPDPQHCSSGAADDHGGRGISKEMNGNGRVRIPERLEGRDFLTLHCDESRQDDVQKEGRHCQKHDRHCRAEHTELLELARDDAHGQLVFPGKRVSAAKRPQEIIESRDHFIFTRTRNEHQAHVIERAVHSMKWCESISPHPENSAMPAVAEHPESGRRNCVVNEFG